MLNFKRRGSTLILLSVFVLLFHFVSLSESETEFKEKARDWTLDMVGKKAPTLKHFEVIMNSKEFKDSDVFVKCYMSHCPACRQTAWSYNEAANKMIQKYGKKVNYINVDGMTAKDFNLKYGIRKVPSYLHFRKGKMTELF
jgi:thiol-disulfide isomerase/thioredoxin